MNSLLIRLFFKRKRRLAEIGDVALNETVFSLQNVASINEADLRRIRHQNLLSGSVSEYIPVRKACEETGISQDTLRRLARTGKIEGIKVQSRKWLLRQDSVQEYVRSQLR